MIIAITPFPDFFWQKMRALIYPRQSRLYDFQKWLKQVPARELSEYSGLKEPIINSLEDLYVAAAESRRLSLEKITLSEHTLQLLHSFQQLHSSRTPISFYIADCHGPVEGGNPSSFYNFMTLRNADIRILHMEQESVLCLENCRIDELILGQDIYLKCKNVLIGKLRTGENFSIKELDISEGALLSIAGLGWAQPNCIKGDVWISPGTYLPFRDDEYKGDVNGFQVWENFRSSLLAAGNRETADTVSIAPFRLRAQRARFPEWLIWQFYDKLSIFGFSVGRSAFCLILIVLTHWAVFAFSENAACPSRHDYEWSSSVNRCADEAEFTDRRRGWSPGWASFWLASEVIFRPVLSLDTTRPFTPANHYWMIVHMSFRFVELVQLFLFLLSIKRKFRLSP